MVFLSVQLKSFYWPAEMKVTIKKNTQTSPLTTVQPTGVGTPPITLPAIPTAGKHIIHWSKERTWKLQHYLPMCGFLVHSENGIWFDGGQVARGGGEFFHPKPWGGGLQLSPSWRDSKPALGMKSQGARSRLLAFSSWGTGGGQFGQKTRLRTSSCTQGVDVHSYLPPSQSLLQHQRNCKLKPEGKGDRIYKFQRFPTTTLVVFLSFFYFYLQTKMP